MLTSLVAPLEGWRRGCFEDGTRGRGGRWRPQAKFDELGNNAELEEFGNHAQFEKLGNHA